MTMLDLRTRDDLVNEATAEHRTIPRSRTVLVELAARYLLAGIVARARGDDCGVLQARAKILGIAAVIGHPFGEMLIGETALTLLKRDQAKPARRFEDAENAVVPELRIGFLAGGHA
jgi:hypothetical protein